MTPLGRTKLTPLRRPDDPLREQTTSTNLPTSESITYDADGNPLMTDGERSALARGIVKAAAKARGEVVPDDDDVLPADPVARAIVIAGKRRRNEI
jgi:hypothetical protein